MAVSSIEAIILQGFRNADKHLSEIVKDFLWRGLWGALEVVQCAAVLFWLRSQIRLAMAEGPELSFPGVIILGSAVQRILMGYGPLLIGVMGICGILSIGLWCLLEALFKGGETRFWLFLASSVARMTILMCLGMFLTLFAWRDPSSGVLLLYATTALGLMLLTITAETLLRSDAVELWGTSPAEVIIVVGLYFFLELLMFGLFVVLTCQMLLSAREVLGLLAAGIVGGVSVILMSAAHSFLVLCRNSTIEIMRHDVRTA